MQGRKCLLGVQYKLWLPRLLRSSAGQTPVSAPIQAQLERLTFSAYCFLMTRFRYICLFCADIDANSQEGYSPNDADKMGNTATHLAATNGHEVRKLYVVRDPRSTRALIDQVEIELDRSLSCVATCQDLHV